MPPPRRSIPPNHGSEMHLQCNAELLLFRLDSSNLNGRYYAASLILGTVALAYGSVPLYKMVSANPRTMNSL